MRLRERWEQQFKWTVGRWVYRARQLVDKFLVTPLDRLEWWIAKDRFTETDRHLTPTKIVIEGGFDNEPNKPN